MIRKYRAEDQEDLLDTWFAASSLAHPFLKPDFQAQERINIRDIYLPNTETWVYEENGTFLGFVSMLGNEVGAIFLLPEHHGRGIGRQLMDCVAEFHPVLEVEVFKRNNIGRAFYDRYGFVPFKEHMHEETGEVLIRMSYSKKA